MHTRLLRRRGAATFAFLVVVAEIAGRSLTGDVDRALHLRPLAPSDATYYPALLVAVKIVGALVLSAAFARGLRAWAAANTGERLLAAAGHPSQRTVPRLRPSLSLHVWGFAFAATSAAYLVHADADSAAAGRWPLFAPLLHTYALPVFAVLAVAVALAWQLAGWLWEVEQYADRTLRQVRTILSTATVATHRFIRPSDDTAPRRRFGLAFESRPPPLAA